MLSQDLCTCLQFERALEARMEYVVLVEIDCLGSEAELQDLSAEILQKEHDEGIRRCDVVVQRMAVQFYPQGGVTPLTARSRCVKEKIVALTAIKYSCPPFRLNTLFFNIEFVALSVRYLGSSCFITFLAMSISV
jgi:hypothetical protein